MHNKAMQVTNQMFVRVGYEVEIYPDPEPAEAQDEGSDDPGKIFTKHKKLAQLMSILSLFPLQGCTATVGSTDDGGTSWIIWVFTNALQVMLTVGLESNNSPLRMACWFGCLNDVCVVAIRQVMVPAAEYAMRVKFLHEVAPLNADVWHKAAIVRCMRFLQVPATREKMDESERKQASSGKVDDSLDPPTSLIIAAAGVYAGTYASFRRVLRARPLLLQLVACTPSAVTLCMGGLFISQRLLKDLMKQNGPISVELRTRCSELIPEPNGKAVE
ncbi:unnamed protein product [Cladocopium goreaui]|uniref:Uncharacterized protein n=1 Tax=Cladocopium goreaui TaxID=2562237 RepID=A0A9P1FNZ3_9DINO|nr:unnamed protein product [Cladocopium goreaui]